MDVSRYIPQAATGQKERLQVSRDIRHDGEALECQKTGDLEARRPLDISGKWCGTVTTVILTTLGSRQITIGVHTTRDALVCVALQSGRGPYLSNVLSALFGRTKDRNFPSAVQGQVT